MALGENDIFGNHPGTEFEQVMPEVLNTYPDQNIYLLNVGRLRDKVRQLKEHFLPGNKDRKMAYAVKASPRRRILEILTEEDITTFDCASVGEIDTVQRVNPAAMALYNHPVKSSSSIRYAAAKGVRHFTVQNLREIDKIRESLPGEVVDPLEIAVRVRTPNPNAGIDFSKKFGASPAHAREILKYIRGKKGLEPGISMHDGSQNADAEQYAEGIRIIAQIAQSVGGVKTMNVGGGIPVNYHPEDHFDFSHYLQVISSAIQKYAFDTGALLPDPKIIIELGRAIIAEAVDLLIPIIATEIREEGKCVYIDDGVFTSFSDFPIHQWRYPFRVIGSDHKLKEGEKSPWLVFGRTCDSGDKLGEVGLPENLQEGDYLWVPSAGAYMDSQRTGFNGFEPPKYISYNDRGVAGPIRSATGKSKKLTGERDNNGSRQPEIESENYSIESLTSAELTPEILAEVTHFFRFIFNNDFPECFVCQDCTEQMPAKEVMPKPQDPAGQNEHIPLDLIDAMSPPACPGCEKDMELFHDPQMTFKKLQEKLQENGFITIIRNKTTQQIEGFTFAYVATLEEAFEREWKYQYSYTKNPHPDRVRSHAKYAKFIGDQGLNLAEEVLCWNCVAIGPDLRDKKQLTPMLQQFLAMLKEQFQRKENPDITVIGETIAGTKFHKILLRTNPAVEEDILGKDYILMTMPLRSFFEVFEKKA